MVAETSEAGEAEGEAGVEEVEKVPSFCSMTPYPSSDIDETFLNNYSDYPLYESVIKIIFRGRSQGCGDF